MVKIRKNIYLTLVGFFLFSQSVFLSHQLDHFESPGHYESCFVCVLDSFSGLNLSQDITSLPVLDINLFLKEPSSVFVKKNFPPQSLPRSPPLINS